MKLFRQNQLREAYAHAQEGGQALHVFSGAFAGPNAPRVFRNQQTIAHLFDQDEPRLITTAKRLGVHVILVEHRGHPQRQHIDLCGKPLLRALKDVVAQVQTELPIT